MTTLPPSREVFEAEILATAREQHPEERLADMLVRYFCDKWMIHSCEDEDGFGPFCLHTDDNMQEHWRGVGFAHVLTVALLGEYDKQIGGDGAWR